MTRARDVANLIGSGNYSSTTFTATAGQTAFSISHTQGFVQVFMNGLLLDLTTDYTSNGSAITLTSGAAAGDEIEVVAYNTFSVGDALPKSGGTMSGALTVDAAGATPLTVDRATNNGTLVDFQKDGSSVGSISTASELAFNTTTGYTSLKVNSEGDGLQYSNVGTRHFGAWLSLDNAVDLGRSNGRFKDLYLGGGAYIGGTGSANKLDDYEEGTWTPVLKQGGSTLSYTSSNAGTGFKYVKIGNQVTLNFHLHNDAVSGGSGSYFEIHGLPFTSGSKFRSLSTNVFNYYLEFSEKNKWFELNKSSTSMALRYMSTQSVYSSVNLTNNHANTYMFFTITYFTD